MSSIARSLASTALAALTIPALVHAQPDLGINGLTLDAGNRLRVTIANEGDQEVPAGAGALSIYIDGRAVGGYRLGHLADQRFRTPGGSLTLQTSFRLGGDFRRVLAVIDPQREIEESNELQNDYGRTLRPAALAGPDLVVDVLGLDPSNRVVVRLRNSGNQPAPTPFPVRLRVIAGSVVRDVDRDLGGLEVGAVRWFVPTSPEIVVTSPTRVRALITTTSADEIDTTNNVREAWLPHSPLQGELDRLLGLPEIRDAIVWRDHRVRAFGSWTSSEQTQLRNAFARLENGEPPGLDRPPVLTPDRLISASDAWRIYLAHVAHALWVEAGGRVAWSLLDLAPAERALLLDSRWHFTHLPSLGGFTISHREHGVISDWDPQLVWRFLQAHRLIADDPLETLEAVAAWLRVHLLHADRSMTRLERWGYDGPPPTDRILFPLAGRIHWTEGCQTTAPLFRALLRAVNLPVELNDYGELEGHRRPRFPTLGLTLAHADEIHTGWFKASGHVAPLSYTLIDDAWMEDRYLSPPVDCQAGRCNTTFEQGQYNGQRDNAIVAAWYLTDGVVETYARWGAAELAAKLSGPPGRWVRPVLSTAEIAWVVDRVDAEVRRIGGGDFEAGRAIVAERTDRWGRNVHGF
ncbi:MAG: hypothetical protein AMXMBFR36_06870 [Acidobacteriota bacterium]